MLFFILLIKFWLSKNREKALLQLIFKTKKIICWHTKVFADFIQVINPWIHLSIFPSVNCRLRNSNDHSKLKWGEFGFFSQFFKFCFEIFHVNYLINILLRFRENVNFLKNDNYSIFAKTRKYKVIIGGKELWRHLILRSTL